MDYAPPVPRKPASYRSPSPSRVVRYETQSSRQSGDSYYRAHDVESIDYSAHHSFSEYHGESRRRPLSYGSDDGRPLPAPPNGGNKRISHSNSDHVRSQYLQTLDDYPTVHSSQNHMSQSSLDTDARQHTYSYPRRPLPEAPDVQPYNASSRASTYHDHDYGEQKVMTSRHNGFHRQAYDHDVGQEEDVYDYEEQDSAAFNSDPGEYDYYDRLTGASTQINIDDHDGFDEAYDRRRASHSATSFNCDPSEWRPRSSSHETYVDANTRSLDERHSRSLSHQVEELSVCSSDVHKYVLPGDAQSSLQDSYIEHFSPRLPSRQTSHGQDMNRQPLPTIPRRSSQSNKLFRSNAEYNHNHDANCSEYRRASSGELLNLEEFITAHDPNSFDGSYLRRRGYVRKHSGSGSSSPENRAAIPPASLVTRSPTRTTQLPRSPNLNLPKLTEDEPSPYSCNTKPQLLSTSSATLPLSRKAGVARRLSRTLTSLPAVGNIGTQGQFVARSSNFENFKALLPNVPHSSKKLSSRDFDLCTQIYSRTHIFKWLHKMGVSSDSEFLECLTGLFLHSIPTLSLHYVQKIALELLNSYKCAGEIFPEAGDERRIQFKSSCGEGILPAFTGSGCYSNLVHRDTGIKDCRCYSSRCSRTISGRTNSTAASNALDAHDWAQYWSLQQETEPLKSLDKREVQRQYQIHEVIYSEIDYRNDLATLQDLYCKSLLETQYQDREFIDLLFGHVPILLQLSSEFLEPALKHRQVTQGPVIQGIGDIFLDWIVGARVPYIEYASKLRYADRAVRAQRLRSPLIRTWLAQCEGDQRSKKLDFFSFQGAPTRRMQRYALLLNDVLKRTNTGSADYNSLQDAIKEIKAVCQECDEQVKIAQDKIALMELNDLLIWKTPVKDLALTDHTRQICQRGELQRKSESLTSWQTRDVVLLDNYLLCLKNVKDGQQKVISRAPIPIDYLVVDESESVMYKSTSSKIIGGTMTHVISPFDSSSRRPTADTIHSTSSDYLTTPTTKNAGENIFPFAVRHAGKPEEKMIFYAESAQIRTSWISAIHSARAARWAKVTSREPFTVTVVADQAFGAPGHNLPAHRTEVENTSVVHAAVAAFTGPNVKHVSSSRVQCATLFQKRGGVEVMIIGTEDGVYSNHEDYQWSKILPLQRVTQVAVLEEFGVLTVLADKVLIAYTLSDLLLDSEARDSSLRRPPQRLSGHRDVGFFEVGIMKSRMLVIYKKKDNGNSVFKCLEPVIGKKQEKKSFFKKGTGTEFFRDFDQFFIPAECYGMQYLRSTICIKCSRGFEIISPDSKQPLTIPDLSGPHTQSLRSRIEGSKPLGTYRVQEGEFLCCYNECGLFVDKYGSVSRPYTLEWEGNPNDAVLVGSYVVAIGKEFIEVWNIEKRSLRQVITGKDIRLIPCSTAGSTVDVSGRAVIIAMAHPTRSGKQLILELHLRQ